MSPPAKRREAKTSNNVVPARERRRHPRVTVPWPAIVQDAQGRLTSGGVIDVSLSGMQVRVGTRLVVGDAVTLRVTLPRGGGDLEISAEVVRRDPECIGVDFRRLPAALADRFKPFLPTWDLRRRAERVGVELPVQIEGLGAVTKGRTVDLSAVGGRVTTEERLTPGDMVVLKLTPKDGRGPMRIRAVVWEVDARGAVLVFANLVANDFARLRGYVHSLLARRA